MALKSKHEEDKEDFEIQIKNLQQQLKERDKNLEFDDKQLNQNVQDKGKGNKKQEFANPIEILKIRLNNIVAKNKEKKRLLDQYIRNAKIIEEAFETIKEGSGITNYDEIVTTFIKAEEQNYSLYSYVNQLNQETDILEENNRYLDSEIERYEQLAKMTTQELHDRLGQMREHAGDLKNEIHEAQDQCKYMQNNFQEVKEMVQKMVEKFKQAKFTAKVAATQLYDENTVFNENNVTNYLAELEEYISSLITFVAI